MMSRSDIPKNNWVDRYMPEFSRPYIRLARFDRPIGTWLLFTMIWLLITALLATILGVDATDTSNSQYALFSSKVDMFSPNGLYQLLLEAKLENISRNLPMWQLTIATICWTFIPSSIFIWRFNKLAA